MAGLPQVAGMPSNAYNQYIKTQFSKIMVPAFYAATALPSVANTAYEGEITDVGSEVVIRTIPHFTVKDYVNGQAIEYDPITSPSLKLVIDRAKSIACQVDDITKYESDLQLMSMFTTGAGLDLKIAVEASVYDTLYASASASNKGSLAGVKSSNIDMGALTAPVVINEGNALKYVIKMAQILTEQNVPMEERYVLMTPAFATALFGSEVKEASLTGDDTSPIRNGKIRSLMGMDLYVNNQLAQRTDTYQGSTVTATEIIFGHKMGLTFASNICKTETLRDQFAFADLFRGLLVYGFKVVKAESIGGLYCIVN